MAINWTITDSVDLSDRAKTQDKMAQAILIPGDANGHVWNISVFSNGESVDLTGNSVTAYFARSHNDTVVQNGSVSGNVATIVFPQPVYAYAGLLRAVVRLAYNGTITTLAEAVFKVSDQLPGTTVDGGSVVPSLEELLAEIDQLETLTTAAEAVVSSSVLYDASQSLTDAQKMQARDNITATGRDELNNTTRLFLGYDRYDSLCTETGGLYYSDGTERNTEAFNIHRRTPYIYLPQGSMIDIKGMINITANAAVAVYTLGKVYSQEYSIRGEGLTYVINTTFTMPFDGYVRFNVIYENLSTTVIKNVTLQTPLNVLVLGNSFSQGSFAYVPKIFEELDTGYRLNLVVGYIGSASLETHIDAITNDSAYTFMDVWNHAATAWTRYAKGGANEKKASDLLAAQHWDIIYMQATGGITTDESIITNAVTPAKALIRLLRTTLGYGFTCATGQWLCDQEYVPRMKAAMELLDSRVGMNWVFPIGTGIANARSNATLAALGDDGNMLYDGTHQQSGIPTLISAYVIVQSLLQLLGIQRKSIYTSTFTPTDANCIAINAYKAAGMTTPLPMTHGSSVGVTDANMIAAKQIASIAARNPYVISDCSNILV